MSLRPIDMQVLIPKTMDYANKHQGELNKQSTDQQMFAQVASKQTEQRQTMVVSTKESDVMDNQVNKDGHNKQEYNGSKKKKKKNDGGQERKNTGSKGTGLFDMKI